MEESYRTLFDRVGALGADAFVAAMQKHKQDLVSGALKRPAEELVGRVVKSLVERHSEQVEGEGGSLTSVLGGDASVRDLLDQYLEHIPDQQRRQLVQVSSTLQLIVQVRSRPWVQFGYRFTGCRHPTLPLSLREGRQVQIILKRNHSPPSHWGRRAIQPNQIKFGT